MSDLPPGKRYNGFTGEIEDAPPLDLAPSPADQRKLASNENDTRPLIDICREAVENDTARNVDNVVQEQRDEAIVDITQGPDGTQNEDVPPINTQLREEGVPYKLPEIPEVQTEVRSTDPNAYFPEADQAPQSQPEAQTASESDDIVVGPPAETAHGEG